MVKPATELFCAGFFLVFLELKAANSIRAAQNIVGGRNGKRVIVVSCEDKSPRLS
jgi:hypothetical protein